MSSHRPEQEPNFYAGGGLDRADHRRLDQGWLDARLKDRSSCFVAVWRSRNLMLHEGADEAGRPLWLAQEQATALLETAESLTFLGLHRQQAFFAFDLSTLDDPEPVTTEVGQGVFRDLREVGPLLDREQGAILAYARGLMHWHQRHRFCGACGTPTVSAQGGHVRKCRNPDCGISHFPRTDPAVIMLIHDGGERCLLGRQAIWPAGMHSTLAGFVEPGESLEDAVARETAEEVGLELAEIRYHSSQPWPFPSSLMLGFTARSRGDRLAVNTDEVESAAWFTRRELLHSPEDERFRLPRVDSIARRLIRDWLETG